MSSYLILLLVSSNQIGFSYNQLNFSLLNSSRSAYHLNPSIQIRNTKPNQIHTISIFCKIRKIAINSAKGRTNSAHGNRQLLKTKICKYQLRWFCNYITRSKTSRNTSNDAVRSPVLSNGEKAVLPANEKPPRMRKTNKQHTDLLKRMYRRNRKSQTHR